MSKSIDLAHTRFLNSQSKTYIPPPRHRFDMGLFQDCYSFEGWKKWPKKQLYIYGILYAVFFKFFLALILIFLYEPTNLQTIFALLFILWAVYQPIFNFLAFRMRPL